MNSIDLLSLMLFKFAGEINLQEMMLKTNKRFVLKQNLLVNLIEVALSNKIPQHQYKLQRRLLKNTLIYEAF